MMWQAMCLSTPELKGRKELQHEVESAKQSQKEWWHKCEPRYTNTNEPDKRNANYNTEPLTNKTTLQAFKELPLEK
jgi:hypothetical protein